MTLYGYLRIAGPKSDDWTFEVAKFSTNISLVEQQNKLLQKEVGGYFRPVYAQEGGRSFIIYCNEDGLRLQLPATTAITQGGKCHTVLVGNCVVVRGSQSGFSPLQEEDIPLIKKFLRPMVL